MKLTTKRNRWYFWRELFLYMIPMTLIVWTIDVFTSFMKCPLHPEWSAPCNVNWILAAMYWIFLIIVIILAIISAKTLRKIKKKIENEFLEVTNKSKKSLYENMNNGKKSEKESKKIKDDGNVKTNVRPKRIIVNADSSLKNKSSTKKSAKKDVKTQKVTTKRKVAKK